MTKTRDEDLRAELFAALVRCLRAHEADVAVTGRVIAMGRNFLTMATREGAEFASVTMLFGERWKGDGTERLAVARASGAGDAMVSLDGGHPQTIESAAAHLAAEFLRRGRDAGL
jgi:hypothetical protein